jgi:ferritin-like metal-binding protein YciE
MKANTLKDVLLEQIRSLYDMEKHLVLALPKMAQAADSEVLTEGLRAHLVETNEHVKRLEHIFKIFDETPKAKPCQAIRGLIEESKAALAEKGTLQDLAIIAAAQTAEHIEMAGYGNARTLAEKLGKGDVVALLDKTLKEERAADEKLTEVTPAILDGVEGPGVDDAETDEEVEEVTTANIFRQN